MSQVSTTARRGAPAARRISLRAFGLVAIGLVVGVSAGLAIDIRQATDVADTAAVSARGLSHEEFVRLNTTDLDALASTAPLPVAVDQFMYWNTTALDNLVPAEPDTGIGSGGVLQEFLEWNIDRLEYPAAQYAEQPSGPR